MAKFQLFTDSSSDLSKEQRKEYGIEYFRMFISVKDKDYHADLDYEEYSVDQFYKWVGDLSNHCKTSLITVEEFIAKMEPFLKEGKDILYVATTLALSASLNVFDLAKQELQDKYPDRKIIGLNSRVAGFPLGLLVIEMAKLQKEGKSIEELIKYHEENIASYHLIGTVASLTYLKAAGRVSGAAAFFGNLISLKPIIANDEEGHNVVISKVNGSRKAWDKLVDIVKEFIGEDKTVYLGQGAAPEANAYLKEKLIKEVGAKVIEYPVGPIIGLSCGPGVIHIVFRGKDMHVPLGK